MKQFNSYIITLVLLTFLCLKANAQESAPIANDSTELLPKLSWWKEHQVLNHLNAGISLGSMGVSIDVKAPLTKWADVRAGVSWLPEFQVPLYFNLNTYANGLPTGSFKQVAQMLYDNTGIEMDATVFMHGVGSMINFKLLLAFYYLCIYMVS